MKTNITFWGGLDTIGGNIAEITYGKDRIIFDFGLVYNPASSMLDAEGRDADTYVLDMLKLHAIPTIDGLYSEKDLTAGPNYHIETPLPKEQSELNTAVFISHLHLDHMGAMDTISADIPVYLTQGSYQLFRTLEQIGEGLTIHREYRSIGYKEKIEVGSISVTAYQVDHDVIGAASFLIETPDASILYSGDIRMHGAHPEHMEAWLDEMKQKDISLLLIEGTTFQQEANTLLENTDEEITCKSEKDIEDAVGKVLEKTSGLALFNMYHRNVERIQQFLRAAGAARRIAVLEPETASIADEFLQDGEFMIYIDKHENPSSQLCKLVDQYGGVTFEDINQNPHNYLLQNSFHHIHRLLDWNLTESVYMHANGMPLGPFDPAYQTLHAILRHFKVDYESLDISGHATTEDILSIIDKVDPKIVVPWHSKHPELIIPRNDTIRVCLPKRYETYCVEDWI